MVLICFGCSVGVGLCKYFQVSYTLWLELFLIEVWNVIFLSKWVICMFHVNLPGCIHNIIFHFFCPTTSGSAPCQIYGIPMLQPTSLPEKYGNLSLQIQWSDTYPQSFMDFIDLVDTDVVPKPGKNWKMNGCNLQITYLERKLIFQTSMRTYSMLIFRCVFFLVKTVGFC